MEPPRPFPPWWHGNATYFPKCIGPAERQAYADLAALRLLWVLRRWAPPLPVTPWYRLVIWGCA